MISTRTSSKSERACRDTETDGRQEAFPQTQWSKHFALRAGVSTEQRAILDFLIRRYWKPVYCYLRRAGCPEEDSKDLVQDFFAHCLRDDLFAAADPAKGRFRNLLLKSLRHFHAHARRARRWRRSGIRPKVSPALTKRPFRRNNRRR